MDLSRKRNTKMKGLLLFAGLVMLLLPVLYSCGGGGSGGSSSEVALYITDSPLDGYSHVIVTIYRIDFTSATDGSTVTVFNDPQGVTYDLRELSGILTKLPGASVPAGSYSGARIIVGSDIVLVPTSGSQTIAQFDPLAHSCDASTSQCVIDINSSFTVSTAAPVVLDFDLKSFSYDSLTNTILATVIIKTECSEYDGYVEMSDSHHDSNSQELKGTVTSIDNNTGTLMVTLMKAEHFNPGSVDVQVVTDSNTMFSCDDSSSGCSVSSVADLQQGMTVEVSGSWNPGTMTFHATKVEVYNSLSLSSSPVCSASGQCSSPDRSMSDFSNFILQNKIEGSLSYTLDPTDYSLTVAGVTVLITRETVIKVETMGSERVICADEFAMMNGASKIEVQYYSATDSGGNPVNVAYKIELYM